TMKGGSGNDAFNFASGTGSTLATIDGEAGIDSMTFDVSVTITAPGTSGYNGTSRFSGAFSNIDSLTANGATDSLTGDSDNPTWTLGASYTYKDASSAQTLTFSGFETLQGAGGNDTFAINVADSQVTAIKGGLGTDAFNVGATGSTGATINGEG